MITNSSGNHRQPTGRMRGAVRSLTQHLTSRVSLMTVTSPEDTFDTVAPWGKAEAAKQVRRIVRRNPDISTSELIAQLERRYRSSLLSAGALVGGATALQRSQLPELSGLPLGGGTLLGATILHVYGVQEALGVELGSSDQEQAFVLNILGDALEPLLQQISEGANSEVASRVSHVLTRVISQRTDRIIKRGSTTRGDSPQIRSVLEKISIGGYGALLGRKSSRRYARTMVETTRAAFRERFGNQPAVSDILARLDDVDHADDPARADDAGLTTDLEDLEGGPSGDPAPAADTDI